MQAIASERWPIQISSYLGDPDEIHSYLDHPAVPTSNPFCYRLWTRMDVTPEGRVAPCILYPDLTFGSLAERPPAEIWNGPEFARFRMLRREQSLPICAKCNGLYLHDAKRRYL